MAEEHSSLVVPRLFHVSLAAAVAVQITATAAGVAGAGGWLLLAGAAAFSAAAGGLLWRLHRLNGAWPPGLVSRVVGGTASTASTAYVSALAAAIWAAFAHVWWLVAASAAAGGAVYAASGRAWIRAHRWL